MQEIYRNSAERTVTLEVPLVAVSGTMDVQVCSDGEVLYDVPTVNVGVNSYSFDLPFFLVQYDRDLEVNWKFDYIENSTTYHFEDMTPIKVVTPLLSVAEVQSINPSLDEEAATIVESQIRHIIENLTGVSFGYYVGSKSVYGNGRDAIRLPMRLIEISSIESNEAVYNIAAYNIINDGYYLRQYSRSLLTIKEMPPEWSLDAGPVISSPYTSYYRGFRPGAAYIITGRWGFTSVPPEIKLAARLLVSDYACPEVAYRDKMLKQIKSGDWSMSLSSVSWETTGNVRADQLIAGYVLFDWALI